MTGKEIKLGLSSISRWGDLAEGTEERLRESLIWLEMKAHIRKQQKTRFAAQGGRLVLKSTEVRHDAVMKG